MSAVMTEKRLQLKRTNEQVMSRLNDPELPEETRFEDAAEVIAEEIRRVYEWPDDQPILIDLLVANQKLEFTAIRTRFAANTYSPNGHTEKTDE
jgi:hypothetical protein